VPADRTPIRPHLGLAIAALLLATSVHAERADRRAPLQAEADALRYDEARQTTVLTGRVLISKGSIRIRGQQVEVRQDDAGFQYGTILGDATQRAYFRQKREGVDETMEGEADRIDYDGKADRVTFRGRAELRRYRGAELVDRASGAVIVYDNANETFTVDGEPGGSGTPGSRVRAVLTPRSAEVPTAPPNKLPPPELQPSDRVERRP
jgi:lipopolysaccharide export system protein LptA